MIKKKFWLAAAAAVALVVPVGAGAFDASGAQAPAWSHGAPASPDAPSYGTPPPGGFGSAPAQQGYGQPAPQYGAPAIGTHGAAGAPPNFAPAPSYDAASGVAPRQTYSSGEVFAAGHQFFGQASEGLAAALEQLFLRFGTPDGYVLGEEASGAIFGGLRYGEGTLYTRAFGARPIFWQGPSLGYDFGGNGSRVMMLAYNVPSHHGMLRRFTGVDGSAYLVGGVSITVMAAGDITLVPVRTGVGARLGVSLGYLKLTSEPTWNPF